MQEKVRVYEFERVADRKRIDFITDFLKSSLPANASVLDVGCGNGVISRHLGRFGFRVTGIDVSEKAIEKANAKSKNVGPYFAYTWWDFNGNYSEQTNPYYYSIDPDNWPECTTPSGNTYCEIRALASAYDSTIPDLGTINGTKYRPL